MKSLKALSNEEYIKILKEIDNRVPDSGYECSYIKGKICKGCSHPTCNGPTENFIIGTNDLKLIDRIVEEFK